MSSEDKYLNIKTGHIYTKAEWIEACDVAVIQMELAISGEQYFNEKCKEGKLVRYLTGGWAWVNPWK